MIRPFHDHGADSSAVPHTTTQVARKRPQGETATLASEWITTLGMIARSRCSNPRSMENIYSKDMDGKYQQGRGDVCDKTGGTGTTSSHPNHPPALNHHRRPWQTWRHDDLTSEWMRNRIGTRPLMWTMTSAGLSSPPRRVARRNDRNWSPPLASGDSDVLRNREEGWVRTRTRGLNRN